MTYAAGNPGPSTHEFPLLTNHSFVLIVISQQPNIRMREIAASVGITERAVQRIVEDLTAIGYLAVTKDGRRNVYQVRQESPLRHPLTRHRTVGELIEFVSHSGES